MKQGIAGDDAPLTESPPTPAQQLQILSALDQGSLARIFRVTRQTYNSWASGANARGRKLEQLLQVLSFMHEAEKRLGSPIAVRNWLLTPAAPGDANPLELLMAQDYDACKGFLLQLRTGRERVRPIQPSAREYPGLSAQELEDAREQINPRPWADDQQQVQCAQPRKESATVSETRATYQADNQPTKPHLSDREKIAMLRAALEAAKIPHLIVDGDCWYSCPKAQYPAGYMGDEPSDAC